METSKRRPLPGSSGYQMIENVIGYLTDPLGYMLGMRQRFGGVVSLSMPGMSACLVSDPALIEHVLVNDSKNYSKDRAIRFMGREVLGQGLLSSEGDLWLRQRRLSQPAFHRDRIAQYAGVMSACAQDYIGTLQTGQTRALVDDMMELTLSIVLRTLLSVEDATTAREIRQAFDVVMKRQTIGAFFAFPFLAKLPLPVNRRFAAAVRQLDEHVFRIIRQHRTKPPDTPRTDLLSMLLAAQDADGSAMSDTQLRDEVITIFLAGHETTALLMAYSFLLLSQNPNAMVELSTELASVLAGRMPNYSDLPSLRYTEAVLLESLRLYPPSWTIGREAIGDTKLGDYLIEKGTQVYISQWVLHRDPTFFPQPEEFRPERWLDGLQKRLPRFAFIPFGGGPRLCIGHSFAMIEASLLLASIASRFRMHVDPGPYRPLRFQLAVSLRPRDGLTARVEAV